MSFKPEVMTKGDSSWAGNAIRFETEQESEMYVLDLYRRWTAVTATRTVQVDEPATHRWAEGKLEEIRREAA